MNLIGFKVPISKIIPGAIIFDLHQTKGLSFEVSALLACQEGLIIDWSGFIGLAVKNGWNTRGLVERCRNACKDAGYNDEVMSQIGERV